jgi:hypothetical protein
MRIEIRCPQPPVIGPPIRSRTSLSSLELARTSPRCGANPPSPRRRLPAPLRRSTAARRRLRAGGENDDGGGAQGCRAHLGKPDVLVGDRHASDIGKEGVRVLKLTALVGPTKWAAPRPLAQVGQGQGSSRPSANELGFFAVLRLTLLTVAVGFGTLMQLLQRRTCVWARTAAGCERNQGGPWPAAGNYRGAEPAQHRYGPMESGMRR